MEVSSKAERDRKYRGCAFIIILIPGTLLAGPFFELTYQETMPKVINQKKWSGLNAEVGAEFDVKPMVKIVVKARHSSNPFIRNDGNDYLGVGVRIER